MPRRPPFYLRAAQWSLAALVAGLFALFRLVPARWASHAGGTVARVIGPLIPRSAIARRNLHLAFPEKSDVDIEALVRASWENLGRTACEYPHLDRLWDYVEDQPDGAGNIDVVNRDIFYAIRDGGKPAIIFTGHLANWELLAICAAQHGLKIAVFFRRPNNPYINALIGKIRGETMGELLPTDMGGAIAASNVLSQGGHIGLLADQHFSRGPKIPFFGVPAHTSPTLAKLALTFDCDIYGARVERLPGGRFRVSITPALPRPPAGPRDERIAFILREVNAVLESWIREHPDQWLWLHRRWR